MFTVKIVRAVGEVHKTRLIEAFSAEIHCVGDKKAVIAHAANGDELYIPVVDPDAPPEEIVSVVFIENANGKTTDVVRG